MGGSSMSEIALNQVGMKVASSPSVLWLAFLLPDVCSSFTFTAKSFSFFHVYVHHMDPLWVGIRRGPAVR